MKTVPRLLVLALSFGLAINAEALTNLYTTHFSAAEGYNPAYELVGQQGWVTDTSSVGGNGLLTNFLHSQAAYVGLFPLTPAADYLSAWHRLNYNPTNLPLVRFSVVMDVIDSTTTNRDDFRWSVYNSRAERLFTLSFYNVDLGVYYLLNGTNDFHYTGVDFDNDTNYTLNVTMDFSHNTWGATLSGVLLATNQPLTTTNVPLTLGDIDAVWYISNPNRPGDNFMIFDDYQVTADTLPATPAQLQTLGMSATRQFRLRVSGTPSARYAVETTANFTQWTTLTTNTAVSGSFDFTDTAAAGFSRRFYRARWVP